MEFIADSLRSDWQAFLAFSPRLLYAVTLLVVFAIAARVIAHLVGRVFRRSVSLRANEYYVRRPDFCIGIAYHDDPEAVIELLERTTRGVADVLADPQAFVSVKSFTASFIEYQVFLWMDTTRSRRDMVAVTNDAKIRCWRALRDAGMTFSTDVTTALDIQSVPRLHIGDGS